MKHSNKIIEKVSSLENLPGIYKFYDVNNQILYIGKSKKLKNRVKSYFRENNHNKKTKIMISKIHRIETFLVNSEMDALLLECNLIKKYQPRYNMLLKDDKTYPWICISNEKLPKIYQTRKIIKDGSEYFGPYRSTQIIKIFFDYFSEVFYSNGWTPHSYISRDLSDKTEKEIPLQSECSARIRSGMARRLLTHWRHSTVYCSSLRAVAVACERVLLPRGVETCAARHRSGTGSAEGREYPRRRALHCHLNACCARWRRKGSDKWC